MQWIKKLREITDCELRTDEVSRAVYSTDASIYEVAPLGVIFPRTVQDVVDIVNFARDEHIALIPRGAATGITGGCLGKGLILDLSRYFNKILSIDMERNLAICECGVVQDRLNEALSPYNKRLGPDTSTGDRATLGGMFANNAAGSRSLRYGCMADHIQSVEMVLSDGSLHTFSTITLEEWDEFRKAPTIVGSIYETAWKIRENHAEDIKKAFPDMPRRVSGYRLPFLLSSHELSLQKLIAGSEGSFGIVTKIGVKLADKPGNITMCLIACDSMQQAFELAPALLEQKPLSVELIDERIIQAGRSAPSFRGKLEWLRVDCRALLAVEFDGEHAYEKAEACRSSLPIPCHITSDAIQMAQVWELRKAGLGLLMSKRSFTRAIAFLEDVAVPPHNLAPFMQEFTSLLEASHHTAGIYGHAGAGCMHIRPYMNIRSPDDVKLIKSWMLATTDLLIKYNGTLSGEHGDGFIRSWLNEKLYGKTIYDCFKQIKHAFDPFGIMNPHKVVDGLPFDENLKTTLPADKPTYFSFEKEGGYPLAVDMCNGNGLCRKKSGIMCPSFQATEDEFDTTRARAQALRIRGSWTDAGVREVLDLCLECKGCKTECPSQVDMAKMKMEFLYHYQQAHGVSLRSKLFGHIGYYFSWASIMPRITNALQNTALSRYFLKKLGVADQRPLPKLAAETFEQWASKQKKSTHSQTIILFNDTFTNFQAPQIGIAAYKLLERLGYQVEVPKWECCGRTALSKGLLPDAKKLALTLIEKLPHDTPIIVLEPSCLSTFIDDYHDLIPKERHIQAFSLEDFLLQEIPFQRLKEHYQPAPKQILVHTHCHQKALLGDKKAIELLNKLEGIIAQNIQSGCCGVAGSFGYEQEHYAISKRIGELKLIPAILAAPKHTVFIANGTSCRAQIEHLSPNKALHLSEFLFEMLGDTNGGT